LARNNSELSQSSIAEAEVMVRHTSGKNLLTNAFLKVVVDTAAMITLVNEKLICGEEHGDEGLSNTLFLSLVYSLCFFHAFILNLA
jgi:hypothetical protein